MKNQLPNLRNPGISWPIIIPFLAITFALCIQVFGQSELDIIWSTNAHRYGVSSVAFSGNSALIASGSADNNAQVREATNAVLLRVCALEEGMQTVTLSHNSIYLAGGAGGKTAMWRISDGVRLWIGGPDNRDTYSVIFSPDDALIGISRSDGINVRDSVSGLGIPFNEPEGNVYQVVFSPQGTLLASANANWQVSLWSVPEGALVRDLSGHSNEVYSVDFSPDGTLLLTSSSDGTARLWRVDDGEVVRIIEGAGGSAARFSADAKTFFTLNGGTIRLWRVSDGRLIHTYSGLGAICLAVAANGQYFAYGTDTGAVVLARTPLWISDITRTNDQATLTWQGGSGLYQLQQTTNLTSGPWENVGAPSSTNNFTTPLGTSNVFYRVQSVTP